MFDLDGGSDYWEDGTAGSILKDIADNGKIYLFFISASVGTSTNNISPVKAHGCYLKH